jgi:glutamate synthase (NADPH/NADH) small chain
VNRPDHFAQSEATLWPHQAALEASRCLFCHDAPCQKACPTGIDVAGFIRRLKSQNEAGAAQLIYQANVLGGSCARVCPVEMLCQEACSHTELSRPIEIGKLQRYAWEHGYASLDVAPPAQSASGLRVAVVGAGPAGLAAAAELARQGLQVVVFDRARRSGGVLAFGIPVWRLPLEVVDAEIRLIQRLGVEFQYGQTLGGDFDLKGLFRRGFAAVFLGIGLGKSARVNMPGEHLKGVFWATELLARIKNSPEEHDRIRSQIGQRVAIIGGGNVAVDVATSLLRLGVEKVELVCLEGPQEMPAFPSEVRFALEQGVELHTRCRPQRILEDGQGRASGLEGVGIRWKKPGLFIPENAEPVAGTGFRLQVDSVVEAIGQRPERDILETLGLHLSTAGLIEVDEKTNQTSHAGVFAAGDVINGGATVVQAVAEGKKAAAAIQQHLGTKR